MEHTENKYAVPVDALERSAHVPLEDQVEEHAEPPTPDIIPPERVEAQKNLWLIGGGI